MDWCRNYPMHKRIDEKTFKMMGVGVSSPEQIPFRWDSTSGLVMFGSELSARPTYALLLGTSRIHEGPRWKTSLSTIPMQGNALSILTRKQRVWLIWTPP